MAVATNAWPQGQPPGAVDPSATDLARLNADAAALAGAAPSAAVPAAPAAPGTGAPSGDASNSFGRVRANKYGQDAPAAAGQGEVEAQAIARDAGLPYAPTAQVQRAANVMAHDPAFADLKSRMAQVGPASIQDVGRQVEATRGLAYQAALAAKGDQGVNVWALVVAALAAVVDDQNKQLQYDLSKLEQYSAVGTAMGKYGQYLSERQKELNDMVAGTDDSKKKAEMTVGVDRQYGGNIDFETVGRDGWIVANNTAKGDPARHDVKPDDLQPQGKDGSWNPEDAATYHNYKAPDGSTYQSGKDTDAERRADVIEQIHAKDPKPADGSSNQMNLQSLSNLVQLYQQNRELLQKNVDKWQNRFQSDEQTKNQNAAALTQVLKNMYDMAMGTARNLL